MNNHEKKFHSIVRDLGCVICREFHDERTPASIHHIAEGSGKRSEYRVAPLCPTHHKNGKDGFHDSPKTFLRLYGLPTEYHLIDLVHKYMMEDL